MRSDLTSALIDHDEAALHARQLWRQGSVAAVKSAGFLVGWRGWMLDSCDELSALTFPDFSWEGLWMRAEDGPPLYGTGPGLHALTTQLHGWASKGHSDQFGPDYDDVQIGTVIGLIAGWGETWPYTRGFRCRYATILAIHAPNYTGDLVTNFNHHTRISFIIVGSVRPDRVTPDLPHLTATRFVAETRRIRAQRGEE